jgi:hypothetical protein
MDRPSGNAKCASVSNPKCIWIECRRWAYDNPNCNPPYVSEILTNKKGCAEATEPR